ncbi:MAG: ferritin [Clostridiales bacterium]|nr:ferritin [Clostridiales bacterium]
MKQKIPQMLNEQINKELFSAYLYLDFVNFFVQKGLMGFAHWYRVQAQEERDHAMLFYDYLHHNNENIRLDAIEKPETTQQTSLDVVRAGLAHEEFITASIDDIYAAALAAKDFRTTQFLDWFVKEQGEEEANANDLVTKVELFGADPKSLYLLDAELGARVYAPPTLVVG